MPVLDLIMSGGQTGADRAALDVAIRLGIPHGGWCPAGRHAEDGPIHPRYQLTETPDAAYEQRTRWNVRDSNGTVVLTLTPYATGGSLYTLQIAAELRRPVLH
jgi:predicted Rossmann-fold nucleotide-binding protein